MMKGIAGDLDNYNLIICLQFLSFYSIKLLTWQIQLAMTFHKKEEFGKKKQHLALLAKALSHPARISILKILSKKESCNCNDLVEALPLTQSTVSQHLKELKDAGLIKGDIDGASVCYCIDEKEWKNAQASINQLFDSYKGSNCC